VLPPNAPLPTTLPPNLEPSRFLLNSYAINAINRISDDFTLQTRTSTLFEGTHIQQYQVRIGENIVANMLNAYFDGWQAYLDGIPLLTRANENGLIQVDLPRTFGGDFVLRLDPTPLRSAAWFISGGAFALLLWLVYRRWRKTPPPNYEPLRLLTLAEARLVLVVIVLIVGGAILVRLEILPFTLRAEGFYGMRESVPFRQQSNVGLEAYAFQLDQASYQRGQTLHLTLFWRTLQFLPTNYKTELLLRDLTTNQVWYQTPPRYPGFYPPRRWTTGGYLADTYSIPIPLTAPRGRYSIGIQVYSCGVRCNVEDRLRFFAANGSAAGTIITLPRILTIE
jgi:hypothetical protein